MMKRIVSIALTLLMILSLASCSSSLVISETAHKTEPSTEETKTEKKTKPEESGPITLPDGFSVGYAKRAANPEAGLGMGGYEVESTRYERGTGEKMAEDLGKMLNELYQNPQ